MTDGVVRGWKVGPELMTEKAFSGNPPLSPLFISSLGFLRTISSVGVSGDMGIAETVVRVMPRNWSATAFLGLSDPDEGVGLPLIGDEAGRRAVFMSGTWGGWSRLRFGEGWTADSCVGGIVAETEASDYMEST